MTHKLCVACGLVTWHNICTKGGEKREPRCTYCGYPVQSKSTRREHWDRVHNRQLARINR